MQSFALATTSGRRFANEYPRSACAMRTARGAEATAERSAGATMGSFSAAHFDADPPLVERGDGGEVRVRPVPRLRHAEHLKDLGADRHRHALRVGLLQAQAHILI